MQSVFYDGVVWGDACDALRHERDIWRDACNVANDEWLRDLVAQARRRHPDSVSWVRAGSMADTIGAGLTRGCACVHAFVPLTDEEGVMDVLSRCGVGGGVGGSVRDRAVRLRTETMLMMDMVNTDKDVEFTTRGVRCAEVDAAVQPLRDPSSGLSRVTRQRLFGSGSYHALGVTGAYQLPYMTSAGGKCDNRFAYCYEHQGQTHMVLILHAWLRTGQRTCRPRDTEERQERDTREGILPTKEALRFQKGYLREHKTLHGRAYDIENRRIIPMNGMRANIPSLDADRRMHPIIVFKTAVPTVMPIAFIDYIVELQDNVDSARAAPASSGAPASSASSGAPASSGGGVRKAASSSLPPAKKQRGYRRAKREFFWVPAGQDPDKMIYYNSSVKAKEHPKHKMTAHARTWTPQLQRRIPLVPHEKWESSWKKVLEAQPGMQLYLVDFEDE